MESTARRFPFAIFLLAAGTLAAIILISEWISDTDSVYVRLALGLLTAAMYGVAGQLFAESRPRARWLGYMLRYTLPILIVALMLVDSTAWVLSPLLVPVGILWMSVAGFTGHWRKAEAAAEQDLFWWMNHRAVTAAAIAGLGLAVVALGLVAIERSLAILFGLEIGDIVYRYILPFAGLFLTPVYWLSTLPRREDFRPGDLNEPDFLSRAIGFLGQFVLAPLLVVYALILIAYAVQIVLTWTLPNGLLGWMVLAFTVTGAANWLVLHPGFMHTRPTVRLFRRSWFWLTMIPLVLYGIAVWVRIDAYGLTDERLLLVMGGVWAALLTLAFVMRVLPDIRLIPGLALVILLVMSLGPWNLVNLARWQQLGRLETAIELAGVDGESTPDWTPELADQARSAIFYVAADEEADGPLAGMLARHGISLDADESVSAPLVLGLLDVPDRPGEPGTQLYSELAQPDDAPPADVSGMNLLYSRLNMNSVQATDAAGLGWLLEGTDLVLLNGAERLKTVALADWLDGQTGGLLTQPRIDFALNGVDYRLIVERAGLENPAAGDAPPYLTYMVAALLASAPTPSMPVEDAAAAPSE